MNFTKMHGCGNDYVYIDGTRIHMEPEDKPDFVRFVSDRHFGIGGDGAIFINPSDEADFEMEMWNADGTRSEMCGNGIRCVAKYVYDHGLTDRTDVRIISGGSVKELQLTPGADGRVVKVRVDMSEAMLTPSEVPVSIPGFEGDRVVSVPIGVDAGKLNGRPEGIEPGKYDLAFESATEKKNKLSISITAVSMGNPHAVTYVNDVWSADVHGLGPLIENHPAFPNRVNAEFVHVIDRSHIDMRVWERGTGETLACGTGACASAVASILNGYCDDVVDVKLPGGVLTIEWAGEGSHVFMTGPATEVFTGSIDYVGKSERKY
ncbi:MAG: diaminopimelate epimerase [Lachnospiraceae bacterium]|nr:diaminopimelate epimerase [Lachnospiraceae bacterium]